jgi:sigma-B regulation protein RsbU (phosphoserine phosphatase)
MADILVIDDDPIIRRILQRVLQNQGYTLCVAETAEEGLELAKKLIPAVVLCDWRLPGPIDGLAICHQLKAHPQLSTTFFLLITGYAETANRVQALEAGADDLLMKPIDMAELKARVKSGMRLHQLTRDLQQQQQMIENELSEAAAYVQSLLPKGTDDEISIQTRFIPSRQLGGDCFDYYWLDPDYLVMYLLDVSGHGLGAALLSTSVLNVLRSQSLPGTNFYRPETVLAGLNEMFQMSDQNDKYFTIWYGVYNRSTRQLAYASAGHPPALLLPSTRQSVTHLRTPGIPIGMLPDATYDWQRCVISEGSRLYIFSDGIYEIPRHPNASDRSILLGIDGFAQLLQQQPQVSLDDLIEHIIALKVEDDGLSDDLSLLEITFG